MQSLDTIHDYLRLCGAPHNLKYVVRSVMLSCFTGASSEVVGRECIAT